MKKIFVLIIIPLFMCSYQSIAQKATLGVSGELGFPLGDFGNAVGTGAGGIATIGFYTSPNVMLNFKTGYLSFSGNDLSATYENYSLNISSGWGVVPFVFGAKIFCNAEPPRFYCSAEFGMYALSVSATASLTGGDYSFSGSGSTSETDFGVAPGVGVQFHTSEINNIDLHLNYTHVITEESSADWLGLGVGFNFGI